MFFNGQLTLLKNATPERNNVLIRLLKQAGYRPYSTMIGNSTDDYLANRGHTIAVNYRDSETYASFSTSVEIGYYVSFEEWVLEILNPKPQYILLPKAIVGYATTVHKDGTVKVGCETVHVDDARAIIDAYNKLNDK